MSEKNLLIVGCGDILEEVTSLWGYEQPERCIKTISTKDLRQEDIVLQYPKESFNVFIAIDQTFMGFERKGTFSQILKSGYAFEKFVSKSATIEPECKIGLNCFVGPKAYLSHHVHMGMGTWVSRGVDIGPYTKIAQFCWITSHVKIGSQVEIGEHTLLSGNSSVNDKLKIGSYCEISKSMEFQKDVDPKTFYLKKFENAARIYWNLTYQ